MSVEVKSRSRPLSLADLVDDLGGIPLERIRLKPLPGSGTIADVEANKCCELIGGTLVEKALGLQDAFLAMFIGRMIGEFAAEHNLGLVAGSDGTWRLGKKLVRLPDVAFVSWEKMGGEAPKDAVPYLAPDLAVEVLSRSNTAAEMKRKRREFFKAGVKIVWMVDPATKTVEVYISVKSPRVLTEHDVLDGGTVLPGFRLSVKDIFASIDHLRGD